MARKALNHSPQVWLTVCSLGFMKSSLASASASMLLLLPVEVREQGSITGTSALEQHKIALVRADVDRDLVLLF